MGCLPPLRTRTYHPGMTDISRRAVLQSAPLLFATLVRCSHAVADRARLAEAFVVDPSWEAYRPVLRGVITAVLPFEAAGFPPVTPDDVERRLIALFPLETELQFLGLQRTMVLFDQTDLFGLMGGPLAQEESKARDLAARGGDAGALMREVERTDAAALAAFVRDHGRARFRDLSLDARRAYLALWRDSASVVKRQFYDSLRALVMTTTWSIEEAWPSIGYAGPLVPRKAVGS